MGSMKNLLNKPLRAFAWYAFIVLMCSIPVYYLIIDTIWKHELKEHNRIQVRSVRKNLESLGVADSEFVAGINLWNKLHPETQLREVQAVKPDSIYNIYRLNKYIPAKGLDRFQGLVSYFMFQGRPYSLTVETNMEESYETIIYITLTTLVFFVALMWGLVRLNRRTSARLWKPFYASLEKLRAFDLDSQKSVEFDKTDIIEFNELNSNLGKLLERNIQVYKQQKEFTENASHELQTPLAIVQSKLDLLLQSRSLTEEQYGIIDDTNKALSRVSRINKNLLLLARIENRQFEDREAVPLSELLQECLIQFEEFSKPVGIAVETSISPGVIVHGNRILVEIMVTNLILNAIRHTAPGAVVRIGLLRTGLTVANTGAGPLVKDSLFKRFRSASSQKPGSGLGLAIVSEICKRYQWRIGYDFSDGMHLFSVTW